MWEEDINEALQELGEGDGGSQGPGWCAPPTLGAREAAREKCVKLHWGEIMSGQHTEEVMREGKPRNIPGSGDSSGRHRGTGGQSACGKG